MIISFSAHAQPERKLTITEMQADYDLVVKSVKEAHGGLYRFSSKSEVDDRFAIHRKKIGEVKNQLEFISLLYEMLAELRDGHMRLELDDATNRAIASARMFPLRVVFEGSRVFTLFNDTPDNTTIRPGMEILTINGHRVNTLVPLVLRKLSGDGFIETGKRTRLERSFGTGYWMFVDQSSTFEITARNEKGEVIQAKLTGVTNAEREKNRLNNAINTEARIGFSKLEDAQRNITLQFLNGSLDIATLRIRSFSGEDFNATLDSVFRALNEKKTKALILDLRGNGGGVDQYGAYLVSQFTNKPFRYFDRIHLPTILPSFTTFTESTIVDLKNGTTPDPKGGYLVTPKLHSGVGEQAPAQFPFDGKLFVLMDGGSFSTTADVTAILSNITKAVFIGEETGGAYEGNISGLNAQLNLPNSKLRLRIHMYEYWNAVTPREKGVGTRPHHVVEKRISDLLKGIDQPMNRALELIKNSH